MFQPHDALLLIDIQNCFMEQRVVRSGQSPSYTLNPSWQNAGTIPAGQLPVPDSAAVVDTANAWLSYVSGYGGTVIATLDYHPPFHCSFCDIHDNGIASGTYCVTGAGQSPEVYELSFNESHVCRDEISASDYSAGQYFQWARHCVAGTDGARLDPYLSPLPDETVVVKLGTEEMRDDYDAFSSAARVSTAPAGTHDTQPTAGAQTAHPQTTSLTAQLEAAGTRRLFLMGLATDYVVKRTAYSALASAQNFTVALLAAGTRAVIPSAAQEVFDTVRDADQILPNAAGGRRGTGYVLSSSDPIGAMAELCAGTCDAASYRAQCAAGEFCQPLDGFDWGRCVTCGCRNGGACQADGTCLCPFPTAGERCTAGWSLASFISVVAVLSLLACMVLSVLLAYRFRKRLARLVHRALGAKLLVDATSQPPALDLPPSCRWHLFLSHVWSSGQDQVAVIRRRLQDEMVPDASIFLDVEDLDDISRLEEYVSASAVVLLFLSRGYFLSRNCLREVRAALASEKPLVLVHETDPSKGGAPLEEIIRECPDELREAIFRGRDVIPWLRLGHFQRESLCIIAESMLLCLPRYLRQLTEARESARASMAPSRLSCATRSSHAPRLSHASESLSEESSVASSSAWDGRPDAPADGAAATAIKGVPVHIKGAITESRWRLPEGGACLYVIGASNPGALEVAQQLVDGYPGAAAELTLTQTPPEALVRHRDAPIVVASRSCERVAGHGRSVQRHASLKRCESSGTRVGKAKFRATTSAGAARSHPARGRRVVPTAAAAVGAAPARLASDEDVEAPPPHKIEGGASGAAAEEEEAKPKPGLPEVALSTSERGRPTHVLLLLSSSTFVGEAGEALAVEIRAARHAGIPILMIHQKDPAHGGCAFERFFSVTPEDLIRNGLYRSIAVPWYPGAHRRVSCAVAAQALGAVELPNQRDKRQGVSRLRQLDPVHLLRGVAAVAEEESLHPVSSEAEEGGVAVKP